MRRYQDLYERQISKNNKAELEMLNTKYFIDADPATKQPFAVQNPDALGNAWFVDTIRWVNSPDEEMAALDTNNPATTAVIDKRFEKEVINRASNPNPDPDEFLKLTEYEPNKLVYKSESLTGGLAVFSEIYYPHGWVAAIDGKPVPIVRADYVLRAIEIPAGSHDVVFTFYPRSEKITEGIAYAGMGGLTVLVLLLGVSFYKKRNALTDSEQ
jgi:hypothetical protein